MPMPIHSPVLLRIASAIAVNGMFIEFKHGIRKFKPQTPQMTMNKVILSLLLLLLVFATPSFAGTNDTVQGLKKPKICMETNIRCILKMVGGYKYWCLKSSIQRNLDGRRNSTPIRKSNHQNFGSCAKMIRAE